MILEPVAGTDQRVQLEKLARQGTASLVGAGFSAASGILLVVVVTNGFSPTVAGTLFASTSIFLILESLTLLGTDIGLVRWIPTQTASGRTRDLTRTLVVAAAPVMTLSVAVALICYLTAPSLAPHLAGAEAAGAMSDMLRAMVPVLPLAALYDLLLAATRGAGSMRPTVVVDNVGRLGLQALAVLIVYLAEGSLLALALAWSLPYALALVVCAVWLRRLARARTSPATSPVTRWIPLAREFWAFTAPRSISNITQAALKRSDIVLVAALSSPADAALYTAATRFIVLGQLFVQSVQQALSPQIAGLFARDEKRAANSIYQAATLWSMIAAWPLYLVVSGFAPVLMQAFGEGYDVATDVVLILSLTMLLATACGPVDSVLLMAGHSWLSLRNSTVALVVNVVLNLLLIPVHGIRGAAIAWAVAIVVRNMQPLVQVRRHLSMWPLTRTHAFVGAGAVVCFGTVGVVASLSELPLLLDLGLVAAALTIYLYGIWTWRDPLQLAVFGSALRRRASSRLAPEPVQAST